MENQKNNGKPLWWTIITIGGSLTAEGLRRYIRMKIQLKRQKKVDNSPVKRTESFIAKKVSADLVHMSNEELSGKQKLSEYELQEFKSFMSSAGGQVLQAALTAKGTAELLKCNIPISELYKINGNPDQLRAFVLKDGKFDQQAILSPAGLQAIAPLLVFQCMAAVTSQYYQQIITERLEEVNSKLDLLIQYLEAKDKAKMKSCYNIIAELYKKNSYDIADKSRANGCYDDLCALLLQYRDLVNSISPSKLQIKYENSDEKEAYTKVQKLKDSHYFSYIECALYAETLLFLSNVVRWKIAKTNNNEEDMKIVVESFDFDIMENYKGSFDSIKHDVLGYIDECFNDAIFNKKKIRNLKAETEKCFDVIEKQIDRTDNILNGSTTTYFRILPDGKNEVYLDLPR